MNEVEKLGIEAPTTYQQTFHESEILSVSHLELVAYQ